jgi:hypothetical protein
MGCNGGIMDDAFKYAEDYDLETESAYPYKGVGGTCDYARAKGEVGVKTYADVTPRSPSAL